MSVQTITAGGDNIGNISGFDVLIKDNAGQNTLAVSTAASRKIVLDADLPRYYVAWSNGQSPVSANFSPPW